MSRNRAQRNQPVVLPSRHRNRSNLAPITPLAQERHDERLHPGRTEDQADQIHQPRESIALASRAGRAR